MTISEHVPQDLLEQFVTGRLSESDSESIMAHLGECETCLSLTDELWIKQPVGRALSQGEELDTVTAVRLERKLVTRIHRSNLSSAVARLGTKGFLSVVLGLLRPLIAIRAGSGIEKGDQDD